MSACSPTLRKLGLAVLSTLFLWNTEYSNLPSVTEQKRSRVTGRLERSGVLRTPKNIWRVLYKTYDLYKTRVSLLGGSTSRRVFR